MAGGALLYPPSQNTMGLPADEYAENASADVRLEWQARGASISPLDKGFYYSKINETHPPKFCGGYRLNLSYTF